MNSKKYPRTYHLPWSPGATSDDKIAAFIDQAIGQPIIITEKLDGENTCLNQHGVFARSHAAPTQNPWSSYLWDIHTRIHYQLDELEVFGESLFAIHSITYTGLQQYFYVFGMRQGTVWLPWEEVVMYADLLDLPLAPVLFEGTVQNEAELKALIDGVLREPSEFESLELGIEVPKEGAVVRLATAFESDDFDQSVFKWVRANHVQTDEHWTRNWKRAPLEHEWIQQQLKKNNRT
ncbi:RNA ligase family protein [Microscilla marina]|uniref:RNA ligase domain-containing protein n=1 Tax=Microscilla marina ATCC 23134 TaxID=313606 RepID=A1ZYY2_MICM2|nr:RNA ligase family protein [Microscilla marina]EAY24418.1 conserved hypothetical protein [Microscilla marina ATCC 23134]